MRRALFAILMVMSSSACEDETCRAMRACCDAVADEAWVGDSCGPLARQTKDAATCEVVLDTLRANLTDRSADVPAACLEGEK